jgi:hypothetical protein
MLSAGEFIREPRGTWLAVVGVGCVSRMMRARHDLLSCQTKTWYAPVGMAVSTYLDLACLSLFPLIRVNNAPVRMAVSTYLDLAYLSLFPLIRVNKTTVDRLPQRKNQTVHR